MSREKEVVEAIGRHLDEIKGVLEEEAAGFQTRYQELQAMAQQAPETPDAIGKQINSLYDDFPGVEQLMREKEPQLFTTPVPQQTGTAATQGTSSQAGGATVTQGTQPALAGGATATQGTQPESTDGVTTTTPPPPPLESGGMQYLKEGVSSVLALSVVGFTLAIALYAVTNIDGKNFPQAKDIIMLLLGPFGTVLGYYFGRLPADARAEQAQKQTAQAQKDAAQADAHADKVIENGVNVYKAGDEVAKEMGDAVARLGTRSGVTDTGAVNEKVQRLRAETMKLLDSARRR